MADTAGEWHALAGAVLRSLADGLLLVTTALLDVGGEGQAEAQSWASCGPPLARQYVPLFDREM